MMKNFVFTITLFFLLLGSLPPAAAQTSGDSSLPVIFDMTGFPRWALDLRRWEIVAIGSFPISMFIANFSYDMYRWNNANSFDMSAQGRRYAPWPLKAAGAVDMTNDEFKKTVLIAIGISAAIAFADLFIVKAKQNAERRRIERRPSSSVDIDRRQQGVLDDDIVNADDVDDDIIIEEPDLE